MKIAVGLIVFNGKPFIDVWLKHYTECPDVDYVVISEGATVTMQRVLELKDAHSNDGTIESLYGYQNHPKVRFVNANKPWTEKLEQQNGYVALLPDDTDYIWIADSDEFYHYSDIRKMRWLLEFYGYTFAEFRAWHFWKGLNTVGIGGKGWAYDQPMDRLFKYHPGAKFLDHRPIKMLLPDGRPDKDVNPLRVPDNDIRMFHYSYVEEKNVWEKMLYYRVIFKRNYIDDWYYPVWKAWTREKRDEIEQRYSIHPTCAGAKTMDVELVHPVEIF